MGVERFYGAVTARRKLVASLFLLAAAAGFLLRALVPVNYDINDYLPEGTASTQSLRVMEEQFPGASPTQG